MLNNMILCDQQRKDKCVNYERKEPLLVTVRAC